MTRRELLEGLGATTAAAMVGISPTVAAASGQKPVMHRRGEDRARFDHGWLDTRHTFSFASYRDPRWMGFRQLRVINDDRVVAGQGFGTHPHRDMEIITWVLDGALEHRDSMGNGSVIRPGDAQRMSAGTGITHSEYNASDTEPVRFLQIWIFPDRAGLKPGYAQRAFGEEERRGQLRLIASGDGREGSISIAQSVDLYATLLAPGERVTHRLAADRHAWLQVARGVATVAGVRLTEGAGIAFSGATDLGIEATAATELLLFDLS